jgi:hypothetical protein
MPWIDKVDNTGKTFKSVLTLVDGFLFPYETSKNCDLSTFCAIP